VSTRSGGAIYVERRIRAPLEALWSHTQDPELHERWDLRFTEIDYLPLDEPEAPRRFRYATRLGFGIGVVGWGETVGERDLADGSRTSALRFASGQARSLIREGRGYWKYIPTSDGVRFLTSYDYDVRYGVVGRAVDRVVFRPLLGWATAWSFDRLRLWLERGIEPAQAARQALVHGTARIGLAAIFAYQGLVPKLLGPDPSELALTSAVGVPGGLVQPIVTMLGVLEVGFAVLLIAGWHWAWPTYVTMAFAIAAMLVVLVTAPEAGRGAFNAVALNVGVMSLALIDRLSLDGIPSAGRCLRRPASDASAAKTLVTGTPTA
jgi:hypothetical protein